MNKKIVIEWIKTYYFITCDLPMNYGEIFNILHILL